MRERLRKWPLWVDLRRWQREGFASTYRRWRTYCEVLKTPPIRTGSLTGDTELHLLCYRKDYLGALWTLKTFYRFAQASIPLVIHVQGQPTSLMMKRLKQHFPDARLILQSEADPLVNRALQQRGLNRLIAARNANHYTLKLTDFLLLSEAPNLLTLDSDVLFFRRPEGFLNPSVRHVFQRDPESTYVLSAERARAEFGIELAPCINVGMMHFRRDSISLERCDEYLAAFPKLDGWLEQTLYALHASEHGNVEYLPEDYLISLAKELDYSNVVARHYAGPSRALLHEEGIPFLLRERLNSHTQPQLERQSTPPNRPD
jgi:hypothetical protein